MQNSTTEFTELTSCLDQLQQNIQAESLDLCLSDYVENEMKQWIERLVDVQEESMAEALKLVVELNGLVRFWNASNSQEDSEIQTHARQFLFDHIGAVIEALHDGENSEEELQKNKREYADRWQVYAELVGEECKSAVVSEPESDDQQGWDVELNGEKDSVEHQADHENSDIGKSDVAALLSALVNPASEQLGSGETSCDSPDNTSFDRGAEHLVQSDQCNTVSESYHEGNDYEPSLNHGASDNTPIRMPSESQTDLLKDRELLEAFLDDANRCLESIESSLLVIESDPRNSEAILQVGRELHTVKGASATVGLSALAAEIHETEELIDSKTELSKDEAAALLKRIDSIRAQVNELQPANNSGAHEVPVAVAQESGHGNQLTYDGDSIRIRSSQLDRLMDFLAELVVLKNRRDNHLDEYLSVVTELDHCTSRLRLAAEEISEWASGFAGESVSGSNVFDELSNDIGEIAQSLKQLHKPINNDNQAISTGIGQFRQEIMKLRRLPVAGMFRRLQRSIRDAALTEEKEVRVVFDGEDVGLEHSLQETLLDALTHVVRNAVSHGIENPDQRTKNRKESCGLIKLHAMSSGSQFLLRIEDDGRGLDFDKIRMRGYEVGLIRPGDSPSDSELAQLIFHPGFSTRESASEVSGRGVGMDVVANVIRRLYGRIEIDSKTGMGTTFTISIPLRSGIEHVLIIESDDQLYAIPTHSVASTADEEKSNFKNGATQSKQKNSIAKLFTGSSSTPEKQTLTLETLRSTPGLGRGARDERDLTTYAVEKIVAPEEVVVRSLPTILRKHPFFDGVTLSGSSKIALIADPEKMVNYTKSHGDAVTVKHGVIEAPNLSGKDLSDPTKTTMRGTTALIVDDSLSARKLLVRHLSEMGIACVQAQNGEDALAALDQSRFSMILTDIDMPKMNGIELITHVKASEMRDLPIAVVSGRDENDIRAKIIQFDGIEIFTKPVDISRLKQFVTASSRIDA